MAHLTLEHRLFIKEKLQSASKDVSWASLSFHRIENINGDIGSEAYIPNFLQDRLAEVDHALRELQYVQTELEHAIEHGKPYGVESVEQLAELIQKGNNTSDDG